MCTSKFNNDRCVRLARDANFARHIVQRFITQRNTVASLNEVHLHLFIFK